MKFRGSRGYAGRPEGWGELGGRPEPPHEVNRASARAAGKQTDVRINKSGCFNQCGHGPMIVVYPENVWYAGVKESDLEEIVTSHIVGGRPVERLRYEPGVKGSNKIETKPKEAAPPDAGWKRLGASKDVPANGMKEVT